VVEKLLGVTLPAVSGVGRDICSACCRSLEPGENLNPVVASLVFNATGAILQAGGMPGCDRIKAERIRWRVVTHLGIVPPGLPDRIFPPEALARVGAGPGTDITEATDRIADRLMVGVLTAPRKVPMLAATLRSLRNAGFERLHIFAEPGSPIPPEASGLHVEIHQRRLGNFTNFYNALARLYELSETARGVILFQDDIQVATGAKDWCDAELFPACCGLVSLFTPRLHSDLRPGWRLLSPGAHRIWGGQALAFRRDVLERFLTDPQIIREIQAGRHGDDALASGWAMRRGLSIGFHTPSLVQHVGHVSSLWTGGPDRRVVAHAVESVKEVASWRPPPRRTGKVGLVGRADATGLGYQNEGLARRFEIDRWLIPVSSADPHRNKRKPPCRIDYLHIGANRATLTRWMAGLDWIIFIERPYLNDLVLTARLSGVSIAAVPNWEWLDPRFEWLRIADLIICPTRYSFDYISDWRRRHGFGWEAVYLPWPIDLGRFRFRQRKRCDRFVFVNGRGGQRPTRLDGSIAQQRRKGIELIAETMRAAPKLNFLLYSLSGEIPRLPSNVVLRRPPADNRKLYRQGDVCVAPSHLEGLGLQLLECQAAGMPLVTTDAPPMNEHNPWARIPVTRSETVLYGEGHPVPWQQMDARQLAGLLEELAGADITRASREARDFVEREHNWSQAAARLRELLIVP
jgi:glycosyltransferase involved in cell wall biosynthesis